MFLSKRLLALLLFPVIAFGQRTNPNQAADAFRRTYFPNTLQSPDPAAISTLSRALINPSTGAVVAYVNTDGNIQFVAGGIISGITAFGTDNVLLRSNGTGSAIQGSGITADDSNNLGGVNSILDGNLAQILAFSTVEASVNFLTVSNAAMGTAPILEATGSDSNIGITITPKGSGVVALGTTTATTVNKVTITAPASASTLTIADGKTLTVSQSTTLNRQSSTGLPVEFCVAMSDETTDITTGTAKVTMRAPYAFTVTGVRASVNTVSSSGLPTVDINEAGTTILSTKLTIDANEFTSVTAAAAAVISDTAIADDAEITFDIDVAGSGARGLKVWILGFR